MINLVVKYLTGELSPDEKELFLLSVTQNNTLSNELIEFNQLLGHLSLVPREEDNLKANRSLLNFMKEIDNKKESK